MNDVRFALRQLRKTPGFTAVAVLTIGIAIGACAAIFSVVNGVLLRPLPLPDPERLVTIKETFPPTLPESTVAPGKYLAWRDEASSFAGLGALGGMSYNLTSAGDPVHLYAARVTASLFPVLGVSPALGRNFLPEEAASLSEPDVCMISYRLWQRKFGARPEVLNQKIQLNGHSFTIVGIMPQGESVLPARIEVFTPVAFDERNRLNYAGRSFLVYGRLKQGVTPAQAQAELAAIGERIARDRPRIRGWGVKVTRLDEAIVGPARPVLVALMAAVGFLLLIGCANVANLLLARAIARSREMAVRAAIGAGRGRIIRQLLTESVLLSLLGGVLGMLVAEGGIAALLALAPQTLPRAARIAVDWRALGFTFALALVTGVGFGLVPAFHAGQGRLHDALKQTGRTTDGRQRNRLRGALVIGEVAIALWLLTGAGLLMRSFAALTDVNPGFNPEGAHVATIFLPRPEYQDDAQHVVFADKAMKEIAAVPGVEAVGVAANVPFADVHLTLVSATTRTFVVTGRRPASDADVPQSSWYTVSPDYFRAMGIPILRGRSFRASDRAGTARVAMISESVAKKFFPGEDPLGKSIEIGWPEPRQIVAVVRDVKPTSLEAGTTFQTYEPFAQLPDNDQVYVVRTRGQGRNMSDTIRAAIQRVDSKVPIYDARPVTDLVGTSLGRQRFAMTLFAVFSGVALLLAAIGIYGVMAYSVSQRTVEIGIRIALGAQAGNVIGEVLGQGGRLVGLGVGAGLAGALLLSRLIERLLFGVQPYDPATFAGVAVVLAIVAAVACLVPARRAARVHPIVALRQD
jgi:putative ABC transport system permease protein